MSGCFTPPPRNTGIVPPGLASPMPGIKDVSGSASAPPSPLPEGTQRTAPLAAKNTSPSWKPAQTTSVVLLEVKAGRLGVEISNSLASTGNMYIVPVSNPRAADAVSGQGIPVAPGQTWTAPCPFEGAIMAIWDGGAGVGGAFIVEYLP